MATKRIALYWGDETDPASNAPSAVTTVASSGSAPTNGPQLLFRVRDFDKDTDETTMFWLKLPSDYASGGTLIFDWFSTVTTNNVYWKTAWVLIHAESEGAPTDLDAAVLGTVTVAAASAAPATAGYVKEVTISLGLTGAHPGDELCIMLGRDADNASDNHAADARVREPIYFSYSSS